MPEIHELNGPGSTTRCPGTGKTYILGLRLKYLIEDQEEDPDDITGITFTSEAAKNMQARISNPDKPELFLPYTKQLSKKNTVLFQWTCELLSFLPSFSRNWFISLPTFLSSTLA